MVYFQTKNPDLGKFWKVFQWKMLVFLWPFCLFYGHMVYVMAIWYILWSFGIFFPFWYICRTEKNLATREKMADRKKWRTRPVSANFSKIPPLSLFQAVAAAARRYD
jgi:hypothetical protein